MSKERKICVSIPMIDEYIESIESTISNALTKGAQYLEFRFDFLRNYENIEKYANLISKFKNQSIYTLRPQNEGGKFNESEDKRVYYLKYLAQLNPLFLDVEYNLISNHDDFADYIDKIDTRILISWHDFGGTPSLEGLIEMIDKMRIFSNFIKVVPTARSIEDSINILKLYDLVDTKVNLIAFCMGELGIISRVLSSVIGNPPFTYSSLDQSLAPGQLSIDQLKSIYSLLRNKLI